MKVDTQVQAPVPSFEPQIIKKNKDPIKFPSEKKREPVNQKSASEHIDIKPEKLEEAVQFANEAMQIVNYHLEFRVYKDTQSYQVSVVDTDNGNVLRKFPPDFMIEFSASMKDRLDKFIGVMVDEIV